VEPNFHFGEVGFGGISLRSRFSSPRPSLPSTIPK
jgi:hypothetical protein